jgi:transposase
MTTLVAPRLDAMTATVVPDEAMYGEAFVAYVERLLAPTLRPGDIGVLGNLPPHDVSDARKAIDAAGARLLFLPPHSPDFNPALL